ncbi:WD repeats and SOF1 domain-containing protein [Salpingoeca rosetta]|uniref:DDB1- and CUL4-associated factor 13 n=1 Tax=Salpingoeca rosetta (strain ATCC 50818 / BSB-021) TaxID=946362 RepID=F2USP9_SALR5|nr:WD repeats and SOF1 domain-containing protein [Salpingoeca rosetta]EGD81158.1 WD repeats and SOF1 domain-containing protein [Salpingoeca rosetta]|eukprot:XP_004987843.1 WD repeats and SOF1 domain-containing protein [Salpingoeca rosetta]
MKVKVLRRDEDQVVRQSKHDLPRMQRNTAPELHPFEAAREYKRALNSVKLERVFAKPFICSLDGHRDGVYCMASHPKKLSQMLSGSADGEVRLWDLSSRTCLFNRELHKGFVHGVCFTPLGEHFLSVGQDKTIKICTLGEEVEQTTLLGKSFFKDISYHRSKDVFVTGGPEVELWSPHRADPIQTLTWGHDTTNCTVFNMVETNIFASTADDRSITLFDIRASKPIRKIKLEMRSNRLCWNPQEAFNFTVANEDHNCYTFDMRKMKRALMAHQDHVSAVMDISYSPTGREFATASYDCSLRIFDHRSGHSREVYHTKRMQRVFCVKWANDNKYITSGSDETNIRVWKATAWEKIGTQSARQRAASRYGEKLKERFKHHPEIRRISRHRHVPKAIYNARRQKHEMIQAQRRREQNLAHTRCDDEQERTAGQGREEEEGEEGEEGTWSHPICPRGRIHRGVTMRTGVALHIPRHTHTHMHTITQAHTHTHILAHASFACIFSCCSLFSGYVHI